MCRRFNPGPDHFDSLPVFVLNRDETREFLGDGNVPPAWWLALAYSPIPSDTASTEIALCRVKRSSHPYTTQRGIAGRGRDMAISISPPWIRSRWGFC